MKAHFNLNDTVKVKLTPKGERMYRDHFNRPPSEKQDEDGYVRMQMWQVVHVFGDEIYLGCTLPIETEIILTNS